MLPVAEAPGPRALSAEEQRRLAEQEENTQRELRLFLRDVTKRLATDKRFSIFSKPVDIDEVRRSRSPHPPHGVFSVLPGLGAFLPVARRLNVFFMLIIE